MENSEQQKTDEVFVSSYTNKKPANAKKTSITVLISILVLSIPVLYLSILRIPPSNLTKDTTFWFILSNSIILLIAADSGIFSSSSGGANMPHACEEFIRYNTSRNAPPRFVAEPPKPKVATPAVAKQSKGSVKQENSIPISSQTPTADVPQTPEMEVKTVLAEPSSGEETSEYSRMSDEELHRRIEEFIRSFNREIKLQQTSGFQVK
ncbi:hypothetical protein KSP40_PGU016913 [Platanthera guangdongensis]|uniref:Uncharacterized protein n=1 Tax=Platanthera guangdongensis TaxID=2320717 RepID=A0ABR2MVC8_9ASPA